MWWNVSVLLLKLRGEAVFNQPLNFLKNFMYLFIGCLGLRSCEGFSLVAGSKGYSSFSAWLLILVASLVAEKALGCVGFSSYYALSSCGSEALWCPGLAAPRHMESSQARDQTCVSCTGRWILYIEPPRKPNP